ncbi:MAG: hypothetical protein CUN56_13995, partial [Phototrophicales bacterium]
WVTVRAQRSVHEILTAEDIIVRADLEGLGPGTHTVELKAEVARRAVADTQPRQITIRLEEIRSQLVPVVALIPPENEPPTTFTREAPIFSESQVMVRGAASQVQQVVAAQVLLNLRDQRETLETDVRLIPVDAEGNVVQDVTLDPQIVTVTVPIQRRGDLREVSISLDIDFTSITDGYFVEAITYEPQTMLVLGASENLTTISTQPIDLSGRTDDFEAVVPIILPDSSISVLGDPVVTVHFSISAQTITRQFENIEVDLIGLPNTQDVEIAPDRVVVFVTGPQPVVSALTTDDIRVVVDLNAREPGVYELTPQVSIAQIEPSGISINPAVLTVTIPGDVTPEVTPGS